MRHLLFQTHHLETATAELIQSSEKSSVGKLEYRAYETTLAPAAELRDTRQFQKPAQDGNLLGPEMHLSLGWPRAYLAGSVELLIDCVLVIELAPIR